MLGAVVLLAALVLPAAAKVPAVQEFDVTKYTGRWFQVAADRVVTSTFERHAVCVTADYALEDGVVHLVNANLVGDANGEANNITGIAFAEDEAKPAELTVQFDTGATGSYWVVKIGPVENGTYQYSVVSDSRSLTLFVLARDVAEYDSKYAAEVNDFLDANGFAGFLKSPQPTLQKGCTYPVERRREEVVPADNDCPSSAAFMHASCDESIRFPEAPCADVMEEIKLRVSGANGWLDAHNNGTYRLLAESANALALERLTGDGKYTDKLNFVFSHQGASGCRASACSASQVTSILDFGTNHCNLFLLYCSTADHCPIVKHDLRYVEHLNSCTDATTSCFPASPPK